MTDPGFISFSWSFKTACFTIGNNEFHCQHCQFLQFCLWTIFYIWRQRSYQTTCISVSVSRLGSIWPGSGWLSCGSSSNSFLFEGLHPLIMQWLDHPSHPKRDLPELKQLRQKQEGFLDFNWLLPKKILQFDEFALFRAPDSSDSDHKK